VRLDRLGRLTRIDLQFAAAARRRRPPRSGSCRPGQPADRRERSHPRVESLARLPRQPERAGAGALFTGAFLVYSLQAQAVLARARNWPSCA